MGLDEKAIEAVRRSLLTSYVSPSHSGCDTKAKFAAVDFEITKEEGLRMPRLPAAQGESAGEAVVQALSGWLFQPGSRKGKPAEASGTLQMECRPDSDDDGAERGSFSQIVNIGRTGGTEVSSPKLVYKTQPLYSEEARRARLSGAVFLSVVIDQSGRAVNMSVLKSLGLRLDENAMRAVSQWRFKPGEKDGKPVSVWVTIEIAFRLR